MAEKQPPGVVEGATTGDVDDEMLDDKAKSAEDRKAAAALSKLDARGDEDDAAANKAVDQEGLSKAMNKLGVSGQKKAAAAAKKVVKVDKDDVQLLVDELDLDKNKATELLKQHDGNAVAAMKAFVEAN